MVVHLVKLCVGVDRVEQLVEWQQMRREAREADPSLPPIGHVTRMTPKRKDEIVAGGSLYWVIKGEILVRQRITEIAVYDKIVRHHLIGVLKQRNAVFPISDLEPGQHQEN